MPTPPLRERFAAHLQKIRAKRGWTQERMAEACGLRHKTLQAIESVRYQPTLGVVDRVADALGVDPLALLAPTSPPLRRPRGRPVRRS